MLALIATATLEFVARQKAGRASWTIPNENHVRWLRK
jgi:hypothetical protein